MSFLKILPVKMHLVLMGIIILFFALGFILSLTAPLMTGSDQVAHFEFIRFIAKNGRLPQNGEERVVAGVKSGWPPLMHILVGMSGHNIDLDNPPFIKMSKDNSRLQLVFGIDDIPTIRVLTTEDPLKGEVLLWYLGRWTTLFSALLGIIIVFFVISAFIPDNPWLVLSIVAMMTFTPTYVATSGVISYEPLLGVFMALYFLLLFYMVGHPDKEWGYLGLGLLTGLAGLTKQTPWPSMVVLPLFVLWFGYKSQWRWRTITWRLVLVGLGLFLTFGVWLLYLGVYFNQINELGVVKGLLKAYMSDPADVTTQKLAALVMSGNVGAISDKESGTVFDWIWSIVSGIWRSSWLTWIYIGLWGVALAGLVRQWQEGKNQIRLWINLLIIYFGLLMFPIILRFIVTGNPKTGEGHHIFFVAAVPVTLLFVWGLNAWLSPRQLTVLFTILASLCLWQSIFVVIDAYSSPWPIQTVPLAEGEQVLATFNNLSLLDYKLVADDNVLKTVFQWRSEDFFDKDYWIEVTLMSEESNQSVSGWLGQPLGGKYPTRAWAPGDRVRDTIYLPVSSLPSGSYHIRLRLLERSMSVLPSLYPSIESSFTAVMPALVEHNNIKLTSQQDGLEFAPVMLTSLPSLATGTISLGRQTINYTLWQGNRPAKPGKDYPTFSERSTVTISTNRSLGEEVHLSLVSPDGQTYNPIYYSGRVYNFFIEPHFPGGDYRLRFERLSEDNVMDQVESHPLFRVKPEPRQFNVVQPIPHPVMANLAGQVALLGYDLPQNRLQPGDGLPVILYWQALKTVDKDFINFNHLIRSDSKTVAGSRDRQVREIYSTVLWAPGEIVTDPFLIPVDPDAPDGIYYLLVGMYLPLEKRAVYLPLMQDGKLTDVTNVRIGPVKIGKTPAHFITDNPTPQHTVEYTLGNESNLKLIGYDMEQSSLTLYWQLMSPLSIDYTTFVHIRDKANKIVAQKDAPPLGGAYPTSLWDEGEIIADKIILGLPNHLPSGEYRVIVGMYDFQTGERLKVQNGISNEIVLTTIQIP